MTGSGGNLEVAGEVVDAVTRLDTPRLLELTDPEVEWRPFATGLLEEGAYRGQESQAGWVVKFRDGRVVTMRAFRDPVKAIESVGSRD